MTQEQFFQLVQEKGKVSNISNWELEKLVEQFPYSQPLRFLYLRQLKEQNSINYSQQLKLTAIYSPDRERLYNYVNEADLIESEVLSMNQVAFEIAPQPEVKLANSHSFEPVNNIQEEVIDFSPTNDLDSVEEPMDTALPKIESEAVEANDSELSPQEIINQRLRELNISQENISHLPALPELEMEEEQEIETQISNIEEEETIQQFENIAPLIDLISEETTEPQIMNDEEADENLENNEVALPIVITEDAFERETIFNQPDQVVVSEPEEISTKEILINDLILENLAESQFYKSELLLKETETLAENTLKPMNKVNEALEIPLPDETYLQNLNVDTTKPHSFIEWLKIANPEVKNLHQKEETNKLSAVKNTPISTKKHPQSDDLIEKFIQEEPRITPAKSNFYSAANMARKSVLENDELVSETLANIYSTQGNYQKAITSYEKLLLKYPEKKPYFAALIENLKTKLNS